MNEVPGIGDVLKSPELEPLLITDVTLPTGTQEGAVIALLANADGNLGGSC